MINKKLFTTYDVTTPKGVVQTLKNIWVWCDEGKAEKAILYRNYSIQGNTNKAVAERITHCLKPFPNAKVVLIETAFVPFES